MTITLEELQRVLDYCPETGVFRWKERKQGRRSVAGGKDPGGYIHICINYESYPAHRLAWLYAQGVWPEHQIDHINRNPSDNRIENLREATDAENSQNRSIGRNNTSGYVGVTWNRQAEKWQAQIVVKGKYKNLGLYDTPEAAYEAYLAAKAQRHTFCPAVQADNHKVNSLPDFRPISEKAESVSTKYPYTSASRYKDKVYYYAQVRFQGKTHQISGFASEEEAHLASLDIKARLESGEMTVADLKSRRGVTIGPMTLTKKEWAQYLNIDISVLYKQVKQQGITFEEAVWRRLPLNVRREHPLPRP